MNPYTRICFDTQCHDYEKIYTNTTEEQAQTEQDILVVFQKWMDKNHDIDSNVQLCKSDHIGWLANCLRKLPPGYTGLYASQAWICFWCIHALDLLGGMTTFPVEFGQKQIDFLFCMQHPEGGFGGGPYQTAHALSTYPAVMALMTLGARCNLLDQVMSRIDTAKMLSFFAKIKVQSGPNKGGFCVMPDGEVDTRALYSVLAVSAMLQLDISSLTADCSSWQSQCQTHEGGLGAEPFNESHGGYSFCGLASALQLKTPGCLNLDKLLQWMTNRQCTMEGGFSGRANKLVDACYSYWVGAMFPMWHAAKQLHTQQQQQRMKSSGIPKEDPLSIFKGALSNTSAYSDSVQANIQACVLPNVAMGWLFDQRALSMYTLICSQTLDPRVKPGLADKPPKHTDLYHTCYSISGLSAAQYSVAPRVCPEDVMDFGILDDEQTMFNYSDYKEINPHFLGGKSNGLTRNHPVFNVSEIVVAHVMNWFQDKKDQSE